MCALPAASYFAAQLAGDLAMALIGQGLFAAGRAEARQALGGLHDALAKQLREVPQVALLTGRPSTPLDILAVGFSPARQRLAELLPGEASTALLPYLAGSLRDRRLLFVSLQSGMARQEFDLLFHLLGTCGDRGPVLRKRFLEERLRGALPHMTLLFIDDMPALDHSVHWPVQAALTWLQRDLNILSGMGALPSVAQAATRQVLLENTLALASGNGEQCDLLAHLDRIVDQLHNYDRDEFAYLLLGKFDGPQLGAVCLELCTLLMRFQQRADQANDPVARERLEPLRWITRRVAEELMDKNLATPDHYHGLVLQKVLLYEEIPPAMRSRVAALQVLTSFLASPQRYFAEIEGSHSPEVLEKRLWRLLEMLPNMLRSYRFDAARDVVVFSQRYGPTFDLPANAELLARVREAAAEVLEAGDVAQQAELMKSLPQMGRSGLHLLIDLADHAHRSVRRSALDGLCAAGPPVVPVLFEALERKSGWHYRRNMLIILGKVGAGGPKVEAFFREGLAHAEAGVRKEALPGVARLLRAGAAPLVAERLDDPDPEVRRRAVACLGMTGIADPAVYVRLARMLSAKNGNDVALAVVVTLNRLRPGPAAGAVIEAELVSLAGGGGWFGIGRKEADRTLRLEAIKALGQFPSARVRKTLERLLKENDSGVARAAQEALLGLP